MENAELVEDRITQDQEDNQQSALLKGSAWLTAGDFMSKILGAIYIIPWYAWMGDRGNQANALFSMGYNVYALFLLISTAGIPVAVSREVAKYHALEDPNLAYRLVRQMFGFMVFLGVVSAFVMAVMAPGLAQMSGGGKELIPVMRSLALAILIFPSMSVIRGYFQGHVNMKPYALSQFFEQLVRIIWMLVTAFAIMKLGSGNWVDAVVQSTTAAFVGMLASYAILIFFLWREGSLIRLLNPGPSRHQIRSGRLLVQTIIKSLPFIVVGSAIQIFKLIDQSTFTHTMAKIADYSNAEIMSFFSYFSANTDKLTMILIGVASMLGSVGIPLVTANYVKGRHKEAGELIGYNIQLFTAFILPAVVGMIILAKPLYRLFYQSVNDLQYQLFIFALLQSILLAVYAMLSPLLLSLNKERLAVFYFLVVLLVKMVLQYPAIHLYEAYGPMIATTIAFLVGVSMLYGRIRRLTAISNLQIVKGIIGIALLTSLMAATVVAVVGLFPNSDKLQLLFGGVSGFGIYLVLAAKVGLLDKLLGAKGAAIRRKLHI